MISSAFLTSADDLISSVGGVPELFVVVAVAEVLTEPEAFRPRRDRCLTVLRLVRAILLAV